MLLRIAKRKTSTRAMTFQILPGCFVADDHWQAGGERIDDGMPEILSFRWQHERVVGGEYCCNIGVGYCAFVRYSGVFRQRLNLLLAGLPIRLIGHWPIDVERDRLSKDLNDVEGVMQVFLPVDPAEKNQPQRLLRA